MKALLLFTLCATVWAQTGFDESRPNRLRISTDIYELTLSQTNGAILGLTDKTAHADLTLGSRNGCLWGAIFETSPPYRGACSKDKIELSAVSRDGRAVGIPATNQKGRLLFLPPNGR